MGRGFKIGGRPWASAEPNKQGPRRRGVVLLGVLVVHERYSGGFGLLGGWCIESRIRTGKCRHVAWSGQGLESSWFASRGRCVWGVIPQAGRGGGGVAMSDAAWGRRGGKGGHQRRHRGEAAGGLLLLTARRCRALAPNRVAHSPQVGLRRGGDGGRQRSAGHPAGAPCQKKNFIPPSPSSTNRLQCLPPSYRPPHPPPATHPHAHTPTHPATHPHAHTPTPCPPTSIISNQGKWRRL
jgi:hypothetical protein